MGEAARGAEEGAARLEPATGAPAPVSPPAPVKAPNFTLRDAALVAEIVGGLAVVVSLVFVGVQLAQSNTLAREAAEQRQIESIGVISRLIIENPELASAMARAQIGVELTPTDQVLMSSLGTFTERTWEALYLQYKAGRVAPELWEAHHAQAIETYGAPQIRDLWERRKHWFSKSYREYRDAEAAKSDDAFRLPYDGLIEPPVSESDSDAQQPAPQEPTQ